MNESLRDTISSAMDEVAGVDDSPRVTMQDSIEDAAPVDEQKRAEAAKDITPPKEEVAKVEQKEAPKAEQVSQEAKQEEAKGAKDPTFDAPASWRPEVKAQWDKIPLPVKAEIAKRERESLAALNEANNKLASREKEEGELGSVLAPYKTDWSARGIPTPQAIAQTLARAKYAYANPAKFIQEFAAENGLSLDNLTEGTDTVQDPELAAIKQELNAIKQGFQTTQQTQEQAQRAQNAAVVNAFADAKDETGNPKHPHFNAVQDLMKGLLPMLNQTEPTLSPADKLAKAYDMACRAHPQVWQQMSEDNFVRQQQTLAQKQIEDSKAARNRAVTPASSPAGSGGDVSMRSLSLRDTIRLAMDGDSGRV